MAAHDLAAARAFPGPDYREVLGWLHEDLHPATYVEIGIHSGCSLAAARPQTLAVGSDPEPRVEAGSPRTGRIFPLASSEFFALHDLGEILGGMAVDFAFIDGCHLFEQVLEDLWNLEGYAAPGGVIAIHDTIPLDAETSARTRTTEFYTGDVWKVLPFLQQYRPELETVTVTTAPTGLTLLRGFTAARRAMPGARHRSDRFVQVPANRQNPSVGDRPAGAPTVREGWPSPAANAYAATPPSRPGLRRGATPIHLCVTRPASPSPACLEPFAALEFDDFERTREGFLRTIPNHRAAIQGFCQKTPVQSITSAGAAMPSR